MNFLKDRRLNCAAIGLLCFSSFASAKELLTVAESSDFQATAHYEDVMEFCRALSQNSPLVELSSMGQTFEKRDIPLLILADPPVKTAAAVRKDPRPVVFAMGNIHAGEVCGKEALLMLARDMVQDDSAERKLLKDLIVVFAPIYNADGNERFAKDNRPGQIGPAEGMGQRPNAMGLDLNRDHMKLESPEARALAKLMTEWNPLVAIDCHTTDGSRHRFHVTYDSPRHPATDESLLELSRDAFLPAISKSMLAADEYRSFFYGNFSRDHSRWDSYPALPRYSTHYFGLRNCVGILSEAYAFISFKDRVLVTYSFVRHNLAEAHKRKAELEKLVAAANKRSRNVKKLSLRFEPVELGTNWTVPGWKEDTAGRGRPVSKDDVPVEYTVRYFGKSQPTGSVQVPSGYLIPADRTDVLENLQQHGVQVESLSAAKTFKVRSYAVQNFQQARRAFQGHRLVSDIEARLEPTIEKEFPAGTVYVPTDQPLSRLIVALLEPSSPDGLGAWNFFDADLEQKTWPILRVE